MHNRTRNREGWRAKRVWKKKNLFFQAHGGDGGGVAVVPELESRNSYIEAWFPPLPPHQPNPCCPHQSLNHLLWNWWLRELQHLEPLTHSPPPELARKGGLGDSGCCGCTCAPPRGDISEAPLQSQHPSKVLGWDPWGVIHPRAQRRGQWARRQPLPSRLDEAWKHPSVYWPKVLHLSLGLGGEGRRGWYTPRWHHTLPPLADAG